MFEQAFKNIDDILHKDAGCDLATFENERFPFPDLPTWTSLANQLDEPFNWVQRLEGIYQRKPAALDELKQPLLHQAFSGQL